MVLFSTVHSQFYTADKFNKVIAFIQKPFFTFIDLYFIWFIKEIKFKVKTIRTFKC